jgi:hypothetical protein
MTLILALLSIAVPLIGWWLHTDAPGTAMHGALLGSLPLLLLLWSAEFLIARWRKRAAAGGPRVASVLYSQYLEHQLLRAGVFAILAALLGLWPAHFPVQVDSDVLLLIAMLPTTVFALAVILLHILRRRIDNGSFGTSLLEVQALIDFMIRHANDFRGGGGIALRTRKLPPRYFTPAVGDRVAIR